MASSARRKRKSASRSEIPKDLRNPVGTRSMASSTVVEACAAAAVWYSKYDSTCALKSPAISASVWNRLVRGKVARRQPASVAQACAAIHDGAAVEEHPDDDE
eukprot:7695099-Alexandrium_andersonii.AAC.1